MKKIVIGFLILVLVIMRFMYLEQDAPAYMIGGICQEDEIYYVLGAVNQYNISTDRVIEGFNKIQGEGLMLYGSHLVYASLKLFGNNYWGLRIPVVLVSLLSIFLLYDILKRLKIDFNIRCLALLYMLTDFYFFLFSRYQTPQIYSILGISICMWIYFKYGLSGFKGPFWLGLFCFVAISFIYVYNLFLIPAFGCMALLTCMKQRSVKPVLFFVMGLAGGTILYVFALYAIGSSPKDILHLLMNHGGGIESIKGNAPDHSLVHLIKQLYSKSIQIPLTNLFRYNLAVLVLFMLCLPFVFYRAIREKSERHQLYAGIIVFGVLQSFFVLSYPFKKWIVIIPLVVLVIADNFTSVRAFYAGLTGKGKLFSAFYLLMIMFLCIVNFKANNSEEYWASFGYGYYDNTPGWFNWLNLSLAIATLVIFGVNVFFKKENILNIFILPSFFGLILIIKICFMDAAFFARDGFKQAASFLNGKGVITDACYASQLYTSSIPALGCYADKLNFGQRYYTVADSLFKSGRADYRIIKVMPSQEGNALPDSNFVELKKIPMKYYSYHIYKYKRTP